MLYLRFFSRFLVFNLFKFSYLYILLLFNIYDHFLSNHFEKFINVNLKIIASVLKIGPEISGFLRIIRIGGEERGRRLREYRPV